jgi:membrane fusion protein, multidrug efflux system
MTLEADVTAVADRDRSEQSLFDLPEPRSPRAWSRQAIGNPALSADAGSDFIRARMPAPQQPPAGERRIVDAPPLHDDDRPEQDNGNKSHRGGFLRRRTLTLALALPLFAAAVTGGYLYWDYSRHFQSTDDAFIAEGLWLYHRRAGDG